MRFLSTLAIKYRLAAFVIIGALSLATVVSTFASQDMLPGQSQDGATVSQAADETAIPTPTPGGDVEATATPTPEGDVEATPTATPEEDEGDETGPRDVVGIPDSNPVKQPEDGDGVCWKGETVVKTTPSGKQVNVPCQAARTYEPKGKGKNQGD
jgi:hypothetical protein